MKASKRSQAAVAHGVQPKERLLRNRRRGLFALAAAPALLLSLIGCVTTRRIDKTVLAPNVQEQSLDNLLKHMEGQYNGVRSLQLSVTFTASQGSARQGQEKDYPTFKGIVLLRKPSDLHLLMQAPIVGSRAVEMVSDGKNFKLLIAVGNERAIVGPETVTKPSTNGLYNLRPPVIRDALLIPPVGPDELVALTEDSRILAPARGKKEAIEEPDYDITVLRSKPDQMGVHVLERIRIIHISRVTLLPYKQDIYDDKGRIAQTTSYEKYQKFGDIQYPMSISITRPLDEYTLKIDVTKLTLNPELDNDAFELDIQPGIPVQKM
jgi:outer membrane lipoprotein-sorting protein